MYRLYGSSGGGMRGRCDVTSGHVTGRGAILEPEPEVGHFGTGTGNAAILEPEVSHLGTGTGKAVMLSQNRKGGHVEPEPERWPC